MTNIRDKQSSMGLGRVRQALQFGTGLLALGSSASPACAARHDGTLPAHHARHTHEPALGGLIDMPQPPAQVTLVVPNFARPRNVERISEQVSTYQVVGETLVGDAHIDPVNKPNINATNARIVSTPETHPRDNWGLMARFQDCVQAKNEWVLITDDDQLLGEDAIKNMMHVKAQDPDRLVCYFGRETGHGSKPEDMHYRVWDPPPPIQVPICLTKAMLTDRRFCLEALRQSPMMEDLARQGVPYWNGEDIWHSLTSFHLTGKLHVLLPQDKANHELLPAPDGIGDWRPGSFDHRLHRETMVKEGTRRLGLNVTAMHMQPWEGRL